MHFCPERKLKASLNLSLAKSAVQTNLAHLKVVHPVQAIHVAVLMGLVRLPLEEVRKDRKAKQAAVILAGKDQTQMPQANRAELRAQAEAAPNASLKGLAVDHSAQITH